MRTATSPPKRSARAGRGKIVLKASRKIIMCFMAAVLVFRFRKSDYTCLMRATCVFFSILSLFLGEPSKGTECPSIRGHKDVVEKASYIFQGVVDEIRLEVGYKKYIYDVRFRVMNPTYKGKGKDFVTVDMRLWNRESKMESPKLLVYGEGYLVYAFKKANDLSPDSRAEFSADFCFPTIFDGKKAESQIKLLEALVESNPSLVHPE